MASMTAREYKEWEAYERAVGPIDQQYEREMLAQLHELIQLNNLLTGAQVTKKGKKNPAGKFRKVIRPDELYPALLGEIDLDEDDDDEEPDDYEDDSYDGQDEEEDIAPEPVDPNAYDPSKDPFVNW
jgi:hypothetical protein